MKYGYARVSTDGQGVEAQVRQLTKAGCKKVLRETASGAKTDRSQLRKALDQFDAGDVLMVIRLERTITLIAGIKNGNTRRSLSSVIPRASVAPF